MRLQPDSVSNKRVSSEPFVEMQHKKRFHILTKTWRGTKHLLSRSFVALGHENIFSVTLDDQMVWHKRPGDNLEKTSPVINET